MQRQRATLHHIPTLHCQVPRVYPQRQPRRQQQLGHSQPCRIRRHLKRPDCNKASALDHRSLKTVAIEPSKNGRDIRSSSSRTSSSASLLAILRDFYVPDFMSRYWNILVRIVKGEKDVNDEAIEFLKFREFSAIYTLSFSPLRSNLPLSFFHKANIGALDSHISKYLKICNNAL